MMLIKPMKFQSGALLVLTLIMLLVISMLGISTLNTSGMEMQMSRNYLAQLRTFEAAELTLSQVENSIRTNRFNDGSIINNSSICNNICFNSNCSKGYCFDGDSPLDWENCRLNVPSPPAYESESFWMVGGGSHLTLTMPDNTIRSQYFIEFRCYTALDYKLPMGADNLARVFRITAFASSNDTKSRSLLRSTVSLSPTTVPPVAFEQRGSWEVLEINF